MIAQNEINVQGELANKMDNGTVSYKHIWQVYVTSELKIKLFCFFTISAMIWIFIAVKNRYLNFSAVLKFATTQDEPKQAKRK